MSVPNRDITPPRQDGYQAGGHDDEAAEPSLQETPDANPYQNNPGGLFRQDRVGKESCRRPPSLPQSEVETPQCSCDCSHLSISTGHRKRKSRRKEWEHCGEWTCEREQRSCRRSGEARRKDDDDRMRQSHLVRLPSGEEPCGRGHPDAPIPQRRPPRSDDAVDVLRGCSDPRSYRPNEETVSEGSLIQITVRATEHDGRAEDDPEDEGDGKARARARAAG